VSNIAQNIYRKLALNLSKPKEKKLKENKIDLAPFGATDCSITIVL
jgi:hypothetical protein